jgi:hypothetical protein
LRRITHRLTIRLFRYWLTGLVARGAKARTTTPARERKGRITGLIRNVRRIDRVGLPGWRRDAALFVSRRSNRGCLLLAAYDRRRGTRVP